MARAVRWLRPWRAPACIHARLHGYRAFGELSRAVVERRLPEQTGKYWRIRPWVFSFDIGEIIYDPKSGKSAEIDVRRIKERQECWFCECRARQPDTRIGPNEIAEWIDKVNRIWRFHRAERRFQGCRFGFEIWTTGLFDGEALARLGAKQARRTRIEIGWRDGAQVREYAKQAARKAILDTLDEHDCKHPLSDTKNADKGE